MTDDTRETLAGLIKKSKFAMLTTIAADGALVAHPLTVQEAEFDGDLWFIIATDAPASINLERDATAGIGFSSDDAWVSLSGTGRLVDDPAKLDELWNPSVEAWFPGGKSDPHVGLLHFAADGAEYWHSPGGKIVRAVASLTHRKVDGESAKLDL